MEEKDIDYSVYNTLNLMNNDLGKLYLEKGYNPFPDSYSLDEKMAKLILRKRKPRIKLPAFINESNQIIAKHFEQAIKNTGELLSNLTSPISPEKIIFIKNRHELLKMYLNKLKRKNANAIKIYKNLGLYDPEMCEILEDSFNESFSVANTIARIKALEAEQEKPKIIQTKYNPTYSANKEKTSEQERIESAVSETIKLIEKYKKETVDREL